MLIGSSLFKGFVAVLVVLTPLGAIPATANAASTSSSVTRKITTAQAEAIARKTFSIPSSYTVANESYQNSGQSQTHPTESFSFQSSDTSQPTDTIFVTIDAVTGLVTDYSHYSPNLSFEFPVPVSQAKAQSLAQTWAQKLFPSQLAQVQMNVRPFQSSNLRTPASYEFDFERTVGGLPAAFNGFSIVIDENGQLQSVHDAWTDVNFPSPTPTVPVAAATRTFNTALGLHLEYDSVYNADGASSIALEYVPSQTSQQDGWDQSFESTQNNPGIAIDALTGKWLHPDGTSQSVSAYQTVQPIDPAADQHPFTEKAVNWDEATALAYAEKMLGSSGKLMTENEWIGPSGDTTWNFTFANPSNTKTSAAGTLDIGVDATYGYVSSYSDNEPASTDGTFTPAHVLSPTALQTDATNIVRRVYSGHLGNVALIPQGSSPGAPNSTTTTFTLAPLVNGVIDETSGGNLTLNTATGQLLYLNLGSTANNMTYPSPSGAVSLMKANAAYDASTPLTLEYLMTQPTQGDTPSSGEAAPKIQLAYVPESTSNQSMYFDAIQGAFVPNDVYDFQPYTGTLADTSSDAAAAQLQLLAERGLIAVDANGNVRPDSTLTTQTFVKLVMDALGTVDRYNQQQASTASIAKAVQGVSSTSPAYRELVTAYELGWLDKNQPLDPTATVTRDVAAHIFAEALGYDALLSKPTLFQLDASDSSSISATNLAADAIAVTLGILSLNDGAFDGTKPLTLSQAAQGVVQVATDLPPSSGILPLK